MIKKLIYIIILTLIFSNFAYADLLEAEVKYGNVPYSFKSGDEQKFLKAADKNMLKSENAKTKKDKEFYLQEAMHYYYMVEKINKCSIDAQIGLGRIYDEAKFDRLAKRHFYQALNLSPQNPRTNLYFANYYYKRNELIEALRYYKRAYQFGYGNNFYLNIRIGAIYEKLADIETAQKYYKSALNLNPQANALYDKIRLLDDLNYSQSQYYLFK
jgi:tetratricopeptide (TPR) repeat protein